MAATMRPGAGTGPRCNPKNNIYLLRPFMVLSGDPSIYTIVMYQEKKMRGQKLVYLLLLLLPLLLNTQI